MVKIIIYSLVFIVIFTSALYLGIFNLIGVNIDIFKTDFIVFIPVQLRVAFFLIILGLMVWTARAFID